MYDIPGALVHTPDHSQYRGYATLSISLYGGLVFASGVEAQNFSVTLTTNSKTRLHISQVIAIFSDIILIYT